MADNAWENGSFSPIMAASSYVVICSLSIIVNNVLILYWWPHFEWMKEKKDYNRNRNWRGCRVRKMALVGRVSHRQFVYSFNSLISNQSFGEELWSWNLLEKIGGKSEGGYLLGKGKCVNEMELTKCIGNSNVRIFWSMSVDSVCI